MVRFLIVLLTVVQGVLAVRVVSRMLATATGSRVSETKQSAPAGGVAVIVPVLNETGRLAPCLDGLMAQGPEVREILVVDGGSADGTREMVASAGARDERIRLVDASPVPSGVNGKAHGLAAGLRHASREARWVLTIDADVRPKAPLVRSMLAHAAAAGVEALSIATSQCLSGAAEGVLHPSMLATLVYRFGIPGGATSNVRQVQANGQCFLARRELLEEVGGFAPLTTSICEDVTLARALASAGHPVGFYEADNLVSVEMYAGWNDAWTNWSRSLPMRDRFSGLAGWVGLAEVAAVQALPPMLLGPVVARFGRKHPLAMLNLGLAMTRLGVLFGMARAYEARPWTYWISPLADLPVALRLVQMSRRRTHIWRGRTMVNGEQR